MIVPWHCLQHTCLLQTKHLNCDQFDKVGAFVYAVGAAGAAADSSFSTMSLIAFAANKPSVRNAGLVGSMPTNTMVGKPCICNKRHRILMQPGKAQGI